MSESPPKPDIPVYMDTTELLLLPDGRVLVHNLTPEFAQLLECLNDQDDWKRRRAAAGTGSVTENHSSITTSSP